MLQWSGNQFHRVRHENPHNLKKRKYTQPFEKNSISNFFGDRFQNALTFFPINRFGWDFFQSCVDFHGGHDGTGFRSIGTSNPATNFKYWFFAGFNVFGGSYCLRSAFLFSTESFLDRLKVFSIVNCIENTLVALILSLLYHYYVDSGWKGAGTG